jgi:hypothetical protein
MLLKGEDAHQAAVFAHLEDNYPGLPVYGNAGASALSAGYSSPRRSSESVAEYAARKNAQGVQIAKVRKMADMGACKSWPDIMVVSRCHSEFARFVGQPRQFISLFIELKDEDRQIYLKSDPNKLVKDERLHNQAGKLAELNRHGSFACFASGHEQAIAVIDAYLTGQIDRRLKITQVQTQGEMFFYRIDLFADR